MKVLLSFFSPVKNDWELLEKNLKPLATKIFLLPIEIILFDDCSNPKWKNKIQLIKKRFKFVRIFKNNKFRGINQGISHLVPKARAEIIAPFAADMRIDRILWYCIAALIFKFRKDINLIFGKTKIFDLKTNKQIGLVGWTSKKNKIPKSIAGKEVTEGRIRVAGGSVVYRKKWFLENGGYSPGKELGSLSDYYINHLAVLQGSSYYLSGTPSTLFERPQSFSKKFSARAVLKNLNQVIELWDLNGALISKQMKRKLLCFEKKELNK